MSRPAHRLAGQGPLGLVACALGTAALAACSLDPSSLPGGSMLGPSVSGRSVVGAPRNAIERALAFCDEKTEAAETACVRKALVDGQLGPAALAAIMPRCKVGGTCTLTYRTRDRLGVLAVNTAEYIADWLVTVDLKNPHATAADLPLTVQQI